MNRSKLTLVALTALAVAASGCLHTDSTTDKEQEPEESGTENLTRSTQQQQPQNRTVVIRNDGLNFEPDRIEVEEGQTVTFIFNKTSGTHSLRIPEISAGTSTLTYESSENFTVTFDEQGSYTFLCSIGNHAEQGMNGTIVVS